MLESIHGPADVKKLNSEQLAALSNEIRAYLITTVSHTGGHLASNLGAVELTIALHRVFDCPRDKFVFDVGHQCYTHKILTGRREQMSSLRQFGGISGFPDPAESKFDAFVAGHASTSVSVALGFAEAAKSKGEDSYAVAVIGDGALTGGMAYEALCNAGRSNTNLVIVLSDNGMAISRNVGPIANGLLRIRTSRRYFRAKDRVHSFLRHLPGIGKGLERLIRFLVGKIKALIYSPSIFENLNLTYLGPVDGHDIEALSVLLERARNLRKPCIVHAVTVKGKGFSAAEKDPVRFHGAAQFDTVTGEPTAKPSDSFSREMGQALCEKAAKDKKLCVITAAMADGCGLTDFAEKYPDRFYDVGIAEEHAVSFAAALAAGGMHPVFAVYSTFLQRGFDQLLLDVALKRNPVIFAVDRAGIVGSDGETHQGLYDISMFRAAGIPILCPVNYTELKDAFEIACEKIKGPVAIRYPRGCEAPELSDYHEMGKEFTVCRQGKPDSPVLLSHGSFLSEALMAAELTDLTVIKLNKLDQISEKLRKTVSDYPEILYAAEEIRAGGYGEALAAAMGEVGRRVKLFVIEGPVKHGKPVQLRDAIGLNAASIAAYCEKESRNE